MKSELAWFLVSMLLPRLFLQWRETVRGVTKDNLLAFLCELVLLMPLYSASNILYFLSWFFYYHLFTVSLEWDGKNIFVKRVVQFLFITIAGGFLFGTVLKQTEFNTFADTCIAGLFRANVFTVWIDGSGVRTILIVLFGMLTVVNEINNLIRFILNLIHVVPAETGSGEKQDDRELRRGKVIGIIERLLFFFFVLIGSYASIGFILTAKGITRFRELDDRNFAEYVLIGTLLSASLSIFWAFLIKGIM